LQNRGWKAAPTEEYLSPVISPPLSAFYRLRQMTAKRLDLMTAQPCDAKLDES